MVLYCEPPISPDTNIDDLDFFRGLQSCLVRTKVKAKDKLEPFIALIVQVFKEYSSDNIQRMFGCLYHCYAQILALDEENDFGDYEPNEESEEDYYEEVPDDAVNVCD